MDRQKAKLGSESLEIPPPPPTRPQEQTLGPAGRSGGGAAGRNRAGDPVDGSGAHVLGGPPGEVPADGDRNGLGARAMVFCPLKKDLLCF